MPGYFRARVPQTLVRLIRSVSNPTCSTPAVRITSIARATLRKLHRRIALDERHFFGPQPEKSAASGFPKCPRTNFAIDSQPPVAINLHDDRRLIPTAIPRNGTAAFSPIDVSGEIAMKMISSTSKISIKGTTFISDYCAALALAHLHPHGASPIRRNSPGNSFAAKIVPAQTPTVGPLAGPHGFFPVPICVFGPEQGPQSAI